MTEFKRGVLLVAVVGVLFVTAGVGTVAADAPDCSTVSYNGDGTEANPYEVGNVDQLQCIENQGLGANYVQVSDIDASGTSAWDGGDGFDPIGDDNDGFTGAFDGSDHTISGLTIDRGSTDDVGLFGVVVSAGRLENITLENVDTAGNNVVGGLVGNNDGGNITESYATGDVSGNRNGVGGLVGNNDGGNITESYAAGSVSGISIVGGLVGNNDGGNITESYATGDVSGTNSVGGLVGFNFGTVNESYAAGSVSGNSGVGGLVGQNFGGGTVEESYWDKIATGQSSSAGGTGLTTPEMTGTAATGNMTGFEFTNTWKTVPGDYPVLAWEELPITASFTFTPDTPRTEETVMFNASDSISPGTIQTYEWDFNGDGTTDQTTPTPTVTHSYVSTGTFTAILTVTDDEGATDTASQTLSVVEPNSPPTASFSFSPSNPDTSDTVTFDGSGSSDSDGTIQSYNWDFGDGTTATGETPPHSYSSSGTYTVELTVTDDEGATDTTSQTISVVEPNSPPTASFAFSPNSPDTSDTVTFDASGSSDPDGSVTSYEWDFGDGTTATGEMPSHSYSSSGTYTVTLTVTDNEGATDTTSLTVSVVEPNSPPTASFTFSPSSPDTADTVTFEASGSSDSDGTIQAYAWDFGDGTTATGETSSHSYSSTGTFTVNLTVTDDDGATNTTTETVDVQSGGLFSNPLPGFINPPQNTGELDPTLYEDINGDGDGTGQTQSVTLWTELVLNPQDFDDLTQEQVDALDWNGDGQLTPADAVQLWTEQVLS